MSWWQTLLGLVVPGLFGGGSGTARWVAIPLVSIAIILLAFVCAALVIGFAAGLAR